MTNPNLGELADRDRKTLKAWLVEFDLSWDHGSLAAWVATKLPGPDNPVRLRALIEMVKVDLQRQWQSGRRLTLGSYLERYPELGTAESIPADLVFAEYQVRHEFGASAGLSEFGRSFPRQASELARLVQQAEASASIAPLSFEQAPIVAERDTSHASRTTDTAGQSPLAPVLRPAPPSPLAPVLRGEGSGVRGLEIPETFGRYRIFKKLGQGGMGAVYLAHDTQLDRQVAVKIPHFSADERGEVVERFLREARAAATIQHPNLCPVYDVGQIDGIYYMTLAYIEGHLLSDYIHPGKPAPESQTAAVVRKLALALQEAHARGIVHRDLKPTNIIINQRGEPVILDFGLARRTQHHEATLTQSGSLLGTPAYMAPEQARGETDAVGPRSDIYSLGVILYELLTGRRPFRGELLQVLNQVLTAEPEAPSIHRPGLDPRLEAICRKAMAKQPSDRYGSMSELAAALSACLRPNVETPLAMASPPPGSDGPPANPSSVASPTRTRPLPRGASPEKPVRPPPAAPDQAIPRRVPPADRPAEITKPPEPVAPPTTKPSDFRSRAFGFRRPEAARGDQPEPWSATQPHDSSGQVPPSNLPPQPSAQSASEAPRRPALPRRGGTAHLPPSLKSAERRQDGVPSPARPPGLSGLGVALWVGGSALVSTVILAVVGWFFLVPLILPSKPVPPSYSPASSRTPAAVRSRVRDAKGSRLSLPPQVQPESAPLPPDLPAQPAAPLRPVPNTGAER